MTKNPVTVYDNDLASEVLKTLGKKEN